MAKKNAQGRPYEQDQWLKRCREKGVDKKIGILGLAYLELSDLGASHSAQKLQDQIAKALEESGVGLPEFDTRTAVDLGFDDDED